MKKTRLAQSVCRTSLRRILWYVYRAGTRSINPAPSGGCDNSGSALFDVNGFLVCKAAMIDSSVCSEPIATFLIGGHAFWMFNM